jgi:hypothetical protein
MEAQATAVFLRPFLDLKDPRRHNVRHVFTDLLSIALLAVLGKSDDWTEVVQWARAQHPWLAPSWPATLAGCLAGKRIRFDGKTLRQSSKGATPSGWGR